MNKILVSGATGFVGSNLVPYLEINDFSVSPISRAQLNSDNIDFTGSKYVIHLAGKAHDLKKTASDDEYFQVNTNLTKSLFDQFLKSDCKVFIFMSSVKAAADSVENHLDENVIPNPFTAYGKSKLAAEQYILSKPLPENKKVYILRPCMVHGPRNQGNLNLLFKLVSKGIPYPLGSFENKRSFLSVANLSLLIKDFIEQQPSSGIYNIADDTAVSSNHLVKLISRCIGKKPKILKVPKLVINIFARLGTWLNLPFNEESLSKLTKNYIVDTAKVKRELKTNFMLSTEEGLIKSIESFKSK
ncbi:MAG: nucleoside-diphosphate-sugar epimerase [Sediminicola sp.]|jgi:nucleoside-diphosphate-sugar epimerase|tara:strand:- start:1039 stop:1941 length:903 start_codon:yes stop_codon:yes gene_type:complete